MGPRLNGPGNKATVPGEGDKNFLNQLRSALGPGQMMGQERKLRPSFTTAEIPSGQTYERKKSAANEYSLFSNLHGSFNVNDPSQGFFLPDKEAG